jgi:hypothetical protein
MTGPVSEGKHFDRFDAVSADVVVCESVAEKSESIFSARGPGAGAGGVSDGIEAGSVSVEEAGDCEVAEVEAGTVDDVSAMIQRRKGLVDRFRVAIESASSA